ncbi:RsmE family RNA methyltransferase [Bacteroidota bacterium]
MEQITLSNIELYSTDRKNVQDNHLKIDGDDVHHISKVMRHKKDDEIYVTDGNGSIYLVNISEIGKDEIEAAIIKTFNFKNNFQNITVCIPILKSHERLEYALEKCTELGITNYFIYEAKRSTPKGIKLKRWEKLVLAAMKQSLRSYLPSIKELKSLSLLNDLPGIKIVFDQNSGNSFVEFIKEMKSIENENIYLVFGPEGGLSEEELNSIDEKEFYRLTNNRLRSETAIAAAVAVLTTSLS